MIDRLLALGNVIQDHYDDLLKLGLVVDQPRIVVEQLPEQIGSAQFVEELFLYDWKVLYHFVFALKTVPYKESEEIVDCIHQLTA